MKKKISSKGAGHKTECSHMLIMHCYKDIGNGIKKKTPGFKDLLPWEFYHSTFDRKKEDLEQQQHATFQ